MDFVLNVDEYNRLVKETSRVFPDKDIHFIEYVVGSYLMKNEKLNIETINIDDNNEPNDEPK